MTSYRHNKHVCLEAVAWLGVGVVDRRQTCLESLLVVFRCSHKAATAVGIAADHSAKDSVCQCRFCHSNSHWRCPFFLSFNCSPCLSLSLGLVSLSESQAVCLSLCLSLSLSSVADFLSVGTSYFRLYLLSLSPVVVIIIILVTAVFTIVSEGAGA